MISRFNRKSEQWRVWVANASFKSMKSPFIIQSWRRLLKYLFPILVLISFVTVLLLDSFTPAIAEGWGFGAIAQLPRQEIRGVWMTTNDFDTLKDRAKVKDAVSQLRRLNFNTIYPVVWNSGYVMYPSAIAQRAGIQPFVYKGLDGHDILADLITQAHRQGLLVIPWFEFGFMAPPTSELALNYPDWFTQKRDGSQTSISAAGEVMWLNPFLPQVQQFITNLVLETVSQYDADGIQFDDHMSLPYEFGYDQYTVALYTKETNNPPPKDAQDAAWVQWRADKITAFMVQLNQAVKQRKPQAIFSVSPNYYDFAYKFHLQDWLTWMRQHIVDELIVQVYRPNMQSFVANISRPEIQEAQQIIPTAIGIMTGLRNNPVPIQQIKSQVRAAQERGLGVTFFYYESLWNDALEPLNERQAGFENLFPSPALRARLE
ncbi:glycoside hydrolase family 10 protein [Nostoc sp. KVJ3]|uniref:glycoside hydrolase family 10 protein n=1 Tax=Nostoc sp. KVJ3 TaxID=457945 RepID=UPI0039DFB0D1